MKPALSVIFFTVSSGAGLGLAMWLLLAQLGWPLGGVPLQSETLRWGAVLTVLAVTAGLLSSTQHLANPRNAWRAVARFGSSWLSREAVLALAWYPLAALHVWLSAHSAAAASLSAVALLALSLAIVVCTAMIYASLKTVPRWRTWHTPVAYLLHALTSGGLIFLALQAWHAGPDVRGVQAAAPGLLIALLVLAAVVKLAWYAKFSARVSATLNQAIGVPVSAPRGTVQGRVRLLDAGHTHGTFLTHEFGFQLAREQAGRLRALMFVLIAAVPLLALLIGGTGAPVLWLAAASLLAGLLVERWLFFAQAEHVVRLYHGQQQV
jgi:DMSO reductase anchor subunit